MTPATQSLSSYLKNGVTATFSGFAPGATVSFGISTPGTGDQAGPDAVADATGTVTLRFVPEVGTNYANEGEYFLSAFSDGGAVRAAPLTFAVTADAAAAAPPSRPGHSGQARRDLHRLIATVLRRRAGTFVPARRSRFSPTPRSPPCPPARPSAPAPRRF